MADSTALFLSSFLDELYRQGLREVVISPGSRSTPLAMLAYEMSQRDKYKLRIFLDIDERSAAFFALGLAKVSGRAVALICTSGTAGANYYPAVLEAEASRVALLVLTADRPARLQGLGAPQTCNQEKLYSDHVARFMQMPLPTADAASLRFARQAAKEAWAAALGVAGPSGSAAVHLNFPFDEPLMPDLSSSGLFGEDVERVSAGVDEALEPLVSARSVLDVQICRHLKDLLACKSAVILAGEGSVLAEEDKTELMRFAAAYQLPVLADPLSQLRSCVDELLIDNYDTICGRDDCPAFDVVIRFGSYPVSKRTTTLLARRQPMQLVVDALETRDFLSSTDVFVRMHPRDFVASMLVGEQEHDEAYARISPHQQECAQEWIRLNNEVGSRIDTLVQSGPPFEGSYVHVLMQEIPDKSLLFVANSMAIRAVDTFCKKGANFSIVCNRGLNGIDGTLSSALGAAQLFHQSTLLTGDLSLLHDISGLALHAELTSEEVLKQSEFPCSCIVVLLNNHGGGIFDMLPQKSDKPYFKRLFLTPEFVNFRQVALAFGVSYKQVKSPVELAAVYREFLGRPGVSLIEVEVAPDGLKERYAPYWN